MNSSYKRFFIWVEGDDDERFFQNLLKFELQKKYDSIKIIKYASMRKEKIINFIKSIKAMKAEYIYVTDINNSPCITARKKEIQEKLKVIDVERIIIVIKEIESWYLAGLSSDVYKRFKINEFDITDSVTKEKFNSLIPRRFSSRIDFMSEILKDFSIETAKRRNKSFKYYMEKYDC